ncbi:MAG: glycosyltransferase family 2 protein [Gemmataceae bacterium]|nr:glycosyltransferase family 2 protein [Gemmataceae bacterium]
MAAHAPTLTPQLVPQRRAPATPLLETPRLSILVVNYRQWEKTYELVRQLLSSHALRSGAAEVIVVDNHSPGHPAAKKLKKLPGVSVRRWDKNRGFAKAVNEGCRLSRGDWFLLLNPDMTLTQGFLDGVLGLADRLEATDPKAGIIGFHLRNSDGSQQLSAGPLPTLWSTLWRLVLPRSRRKYKTPRATQRAPAPWVTGCCLLLKSACIRDLGGLDEAFFLYYEDVDLCLRARQKGWTVWYEPDLAVIHHHPLHSRPVPAALRLVTRHSLLTYGAKHWAGWQFRLLARIIRAEAWVRRVFAWWRGDGRQAAFFRELAGLTRDMLHGDEAAARRRIDRAVEHIDVRVGV